MFEKTVCFLSYPPGNVCLYLEEDFLNFILCVIQEPNFCTFHVVDIEFCLALFNKISS